MQQEAKIQECIPDPGKISTIVWDLGGVLYETDLQKTLDGFKTLAKPSDNVILPEAKSLLDHPTFAKTDTDEMGPDDLRAYLRSEFKVEASDAQIDEAWNALLIGIIPGRTELLKSLKGHFRLLLLSNTNRIHQDFLREECKELFSLFDKVYFSYDLKMRKPNVGIYQKVSELEGLEMEECLFFDDNLPNVTGAKEAGWQACHYEEEEKMLQQIQTLLDSKHFNTENHALT